MAFFSRWWNQQDDATRHVVKGLVNEGMRYVLRVVRYKKLNSTESLMNVSTLIFMQCSFSRKHVHFKFDRLDN